jgi:putative chitinase
MLITVAQLVAAGLAPTQARTFAEPLSAACALFAIDTPSRVAAFVAQCRVESENFTKLEEGLYYTRPEWIKKVFSSRVATLQDAQRLARNPKLLANTVYAGKNGNGDFASGHGWLYRGRGLIGLTGLDNYAAAEKGTGRPYVAQPDLVATPSDACLASAWFWHSNALNRFADAALTDAITRSVNGPAMMHADLRRQYTEEGARAFA